MVELNNGKKRGPAMKGQKTPQISMRNAKGTVHLLVCLHLLLYDLIKYLLFLDLLSLKDIFFYILVKIS